MRESVERWTREQGMVDDITIVIAFLSVGGGSENNPNTATSQNNLNHPHPAGES